MIGRFYLNFGLILLFATCSKEDSPQSDPPFPENRSFYMGFTAFPYDLTPEAIADTYQNVGRDGDIYLNHLDHGVPWDEALNELPFPDEINNTLLEANEARGHGQKLFLTATPTNQSRDALADYWNNHGTHQPLPANWKGKKFNDPMVISAYLKYCHRIIDISNPDYFAFGIEINGSFREGTDEFEEFLDLAAIVYDSLKISYPQIPIMMTFQNQSFNNSKIELLKTTKKLAEFSDFIAMSTYPFWWYDFPTRAANPALFSDNWLTDFRNVDVSKPFAISETGFIAEDLDLPAYGVNIKGQPEWQEEYLQKLFIHANDLDAKFLCWFVYRDYDKLYDAYPSDIFKIWRDNGLLDGKGIKRPAYESWINWKKLPRE